MEKIVLGIWVIVLWIQTICDIKWKRIPMIITVVGVVAGIFYCLMTQRNWVDILWAVAPGIFCLLYSKISNETLGYGDGLLLCAMGLYLEVEHILFIAMLAFGLAGIGGLVLVVFFHKKRNDEIPFVPFLLAAFLVDIVIQIGEHYG